jgi:hypothetical protein
MKELYPAEEDATGMEIRSAMVRTGKREVAPCKCRMLTK